MSQAVSSLKGVGVYVGQSCPHSVALGCSVGLGSPNRAALPRILSPWLIVVLKSQCWPVIGGL